MDTNVTAAAIPAVPLATGMPEKDDRRKAGRVIWVYVLGILGVHALACLAFVPWLFNWPNVLVMAAGVLLFGQGVNLGYHRLLTHRGLKVPRWFEYALVVAALCSLQDTPVRWVTAHRYHHRYSDQRNDVHSPSAGFFWSHMGWLFRENRNSQPAAHQLQWKSKLGNGDTVSRTFEEVGLYIADAGGSSTSTSTTLWVHANYAGVALATADAIEFTITLSAS